MQSIKGNAGNKGGNLTSGFDGGKCESWRPLIGRKTKREGVAFPLGVSIYAEIA